MSERAVRKGKGPLESRLKCVALEPYQSEMWRLENVDFVTGILLRIKSCYSLHPPPPPPPSSSTVLTSILLQLSAYVLRDHKIVDLR